MLFAGFTEVTVNVLPQKTEKNINGEISYVLKYMPGKKGCKVDRVNIEISTLAFGVCLSGVIVAGPLVILAHSATSGIQGQAAAMLSSEGLVRVGRPASSVVGLYGT